MIYFFLALVEIVFSFFGVADLRSVLEATTLDFTDLSKCKKICNLNTNSVVLSSATVNQILAQIVASKDDTRILTNRTITLNGSASSGAPTGQGIVDASLLRTYHTPTNAPANAVWTITTR